MMDDIILNIRNVDGIIISYKIEKAKITIGRSPHNDIHLNDSFASRFHAEIIFHNGNYLIRDNNSANGTFVNSYKINEAVKLHHRDVIKIGKTMIEFNNFNELNKSMNYFAKEYSQYYMFESNIVKSMKFKPVNEIISLDDNKILDERAKIGTIHDSSYRYIERYEKGSLLNIICNLGLALLPNNALEETLKIIVQAIFDAIPADRAFLFLKEGDELICKIAMDNKKNYIDNMHIRLSRSIANKVITEHNSILMYDAMIDPYFKDQSSILMNRIGSVIAAPMLIDDEILGMIYVDNPVESSFNENDLKVITTIASVAAIKIKHYKLLEELIAKNKIEKELELAAEIQLNLQPKEFPAIEEWDISGLSIPC